MITQSILVLVSSQSERSYVIEDHYSDDGRISRVEGLRDNGDFEQQMLDRVPQVEAQLQAEAEAQEVAENTKIAQEKVDAFVSKLDLSEIGLTADEVVAFNKE